MSKKEIEFITRIKGGTVRRGYAEHHNLEIFIPKMITETNNLKKNMTVRVKMKEVK